MSAWTKECKEAIISSGDKQIKRGMMDLVMELAEGVIVRDRRAYVSTSLRR